MAINLAAKIWLCIIILRDFMTDLATFEHYYKLTDLLIEESTKEQLAEGLRLLAMNITHYQMKYGEIALDDTLVLVDATEPNEEQLNLLVLGLETLVGVLRNVISGVGEAKH